MAWTAENIAMAEAMQRRDLIAQETEDLDIANTQGIEPDGSMVVPHDPTPQQKAYLARRIGLDMRRQWSENQRNGSDKLPELPKLRPGDIVH